MIYTISHPTIAFSSVNKSKAEFFEKKLADITRDDILKNLVPNRHALLVEMGLAGDAPIFEEYFHARGLVRERIDAVVSSVPKKLRQYKYAEVEPEIIANIESELGWVIESHY